MFSCQIAVCDRHRADRMNIFSSILPWERKNRPRAERSSLPRTEKLRGATLVRKKCALTGTNIPRQITLVTRRRILGKMPLTAPSAVHLTVAFSPGSHLPGLSVQRVPPLSPHQRFNYRKSIAQAAPRVKSFCQKRIKSKFSLRLHAY